MTQESFTIGMLAKKAGVNVETIRFYQRRQLLAEPERPLHGARRYTEHDARRVRLIKHIQKIGFSLDEIAELLSLEKGPNCRAVRDRVLAKLALIQERIESLRAVERNLSDLAERCLRNTDETCCPALSVLLEQAS